MLAKLIVEALYHNVCILGASHCLCLFLRPVVCSFAIDFHSVMRSGNGYGETNHRVAVWIHHITFVMCLCGQFTTKS
jgi:hypothetical protein